MTAFTPTYAHARICLSAWRGALFVAPHQKFRLPTAKARYPLLMERFAPLMVKPQQVGALSLARPMENYKYISCLARLSQPKHISRMQEPESTPTTPPSFRALSRRCLFKGSMVRLSVIHIRVFSMFPSTLLAFAWALSNHARTSPLDSPASVFCYESNNSHAQNLGNECAEHAAALVTLGLVPKQSVRTRWTHLSFDSNLLFAPCDSLGDVLQVLRDVRTESVSASQCSVRS